MLGKQGSRAEGEGKIFPPKSKKPLCNSQNPLLGGDDTLYTSPVICQNLIDLKHAHTIEILRKWRLECMIAFFIQIIYQNQSNNGFYDCL